MKKESKYATLEDVDFVEKTIKEVQSENSSDNNFNLGLFYGLVFGIIGNLFVTILFDSLLKDLSYEIKTIIFLIIAGIMVFFIIIMRKEDTQFRMNNIKINNNLTNLEYFRDKIKKGEKILKFDLLDARNPIEKALEDRNFSTAPLQAQNTSHNQTDSH
jgi:hypothetical protein